MPRLMDRMEDFAADDADEPGGNSDMMGDSGPPDFAGVPEMEASGYDPSHIDGDTEGDGYDPSHIDGGDTEGDGYDSAGETEGDGYDPSHIDGDDDREDPGSGKTDYAGAAGAWPEGDTEGDTEGDIDGEFAPSWGNDQDAGPGPEDGEDATDAQADDPGEQGPEPPASPRPGRAHRVFHAAKRAHGLTRELMPHRLADRFTPKFAKKFMPHTYAAKALKKFKLWGDTGPFIGIGGDAAPECGSEATFDIYKSGKGWSGVVRIPTEAGRALMMATSPSASKAAAASKAINMTRAAAASPMLKAMVPPQARLALMAANHPLAKKALGRLFRR